MLKNKIALITGAGRGIGRAIAIALAKEGAEVVINYNGSEERAKEVKQTIEENGGKASIYKCNVSDFAACEAMIKDIVKEYGHLDILVNNAGITKDGLIMKMKEEDFDSVLNVNLKGTFNTIRHSARQMLKQRSGKIINISSVSGILGNVGQANYAASKAGSKVTQHRTPITTPLAITIPISRPSEKVIKQSAINPATVVIELPITDLKVALMACAIALSLSPSNRFLFSS